MKKIQYVFFAVLICTLARPSLSLADVNCVTSVRVMHGLVFEDSGGGITVNMLPFDPAVAKTVGHPKKASPSELSQNRKNLRRVKFYAASWCPYCKKMEQFLQYARIPYRKYDIDYDAAANRRLNELGAEGVPVVDVNGYVIYGYDPQSVKEAWDDWNGS
jgi:glutaredoxin